MLLESFNDRDVLRHFLKHGGRETIVSFGMLQDQFNKMSSAAVPSEGAGRQEPLAKRDAPPAAAGEAA